MTLRFSIVPTINGRLAFIQILHKEAELLELMPLSGFFSPPFVFEVRNLLLMAGKMYIPDIYQHIHRNLHYSRFSHAVKILPTFKKLEKLGIWS